MIFKTILLLTLSLYLTSPLAAEIVKKSKSGICHDSTSSYYSRTKNYTAYKSLHECLDSGGTLTKSNKPKTVSSSEYSRSQFGSGWKDTDKDCQDSRTEALVSQSVGTIHYKTDKHCEVVRGKWISPFTGEIIYIASTIDIDHVVPLKFAWIFGADKWTKDKRIQFANDPANLLSVEASLNRQKGAKGLDQWLPSKNQCQYILRFERISKKYKLEIPNDKKQQFLILRNKHC